MSSFLHFTFVSLNSSIKLADKMTMFERETGHRSLLRINVIIDVVFYSIVVVVL